MLFVFLVEYRLPVLAAAEEMPSDDMATVANTVTLAGPPSVVFDFVTTARFWPCWHPASLAVGGVTERPYGSRDHIHEWARIGSQDFHVVWKVVKHRYPSQVVLQSEAPLVRIL